MLKDILIAFPGQGGSFNKAQGEQNKESSHPELDLLHQTIKNYEDLQVKFPWLDPKRVFGNSAGLYAALVVGGVASYFVVRELLERRSKIVQETEGNSKYPTNMVGIIGVDHKGVVDLITPYNQDIVGRNNMLPDRAEKIPLIIETNDNGPLAKVIGGPKEYLDFVVEKLGGRAKPLNIPAYHHPVRCEDSVRYARQIRDAVFGSPRKTIISSTNVRVLMTPEDVEEELAGQLVRPVSLPQVARLWQGVSAAIDNGPGNTMQKLFARIIGKEFPFFSLETDQDRIGKLNEQA